MRYQHPDKVRPLKLHDHVLLSTRQGGRIAVDQTLLKIWGSADGRSLEEISSYFQDSELDFGLIRAALVCLCEAGLLTRVYVGGQPSENMVSLARNDLHVSVSVVIVNYNSREWLDECLPSLQSQTLLPAEIIVVDNGSIEDPGTWLDEYYPEIIQFHLREPQSLAAALNRGVSLAGGDYFLLLNPDTRLEPDSLRQMLWVAERDRACGAVAPLLKFSWAPSFLNGLGNYAGAFSWGMDHGLGHLDLGQFEGITEVPSACFAAALIPRSTWDSVGPLDEGFPLYYEDIEWSYRARLMGYRILAAPNSVIYHAFGRRVHNGMDTDLSPTKLTSVTYGRLRFAAKIFSNWGSFKFKLSYALDDLIRGAFALLTGNGKIIRAYVQGWRCYMKNRAQIYQQKMALKSKLALKDRELLAIQKNLPDPFIWQGLPELTWDSIVSHYMPLIKSDRSRSYPEIENIRPKFLIISNEIIDVKLAGPGMRYLEMARILSDDLHVTLVIPGETTLDEPGFSFVAYDESRSDDLRPLVESHDVVLITAFSLNKFPFLNQVSAHLIVDLYDPFIFENLFYYQDEPLAMQMDINRQSIDLLNRVVSLGDYFICGSERQRDLWIGLLLANGRVNPHTFDQDASLRQLIDVVGIGFPDRDPNMHPFLRGIHPQFPEECRIVIWGGGVWDWLDPLTLIHSWTQVLAAHPEARLVILGTKHPNPDVPQHKVVPKLESVAEQIGEKDRSIFFFEWLSYQDREALLSEADIGVTLHPTHVETRFSIRTRVLDYIWAGLPILVSEGDVTSDWVDDYRLGRVVPPQDPDEVAKALVEILSVPKSTWQPQFDRIRGQFRWSDVVEPLRQYCLNQFPAADHRSLRHLENQNPELAVWRSRLARARFIWRNQGGKALMVRISKNIRKYLSNLL